MKTRPYSKLTNEQLVAMLEQTEDAWAALSIEYFARTCSDVGSIGEGSINRRDWLAYLNASSDRQSVIAGLSPSQRKALGL